MIWTLTSEMLAIKWCGQRTRGCRSVKFGCLQACRKRADVVEPTSCSKAIQVSVPEEDRCGNASLLQVVAKNSWMNFLESQGIRPLNLCWLIQSGHTSCRRCATRHKAVRKAAGKRPGAPQAMGYKQNNHQAIRALVMNDDHPGSLEDVEV